ncbi:MAG: hypothetical protein LBT91_02640 [Bifidobacteriaceae bacterium]|jgi:hypothetical protein|nr:hypothetical protein [Bifidobacteriaceae bacterium]
MNKLTEKYKNWDLSDFDFDLPDDKKFAGHNEIVGGETEEQFQERRVKNYIRHELTDYDDLRCYINTYNEIFGFHDDYVPDDEFYSSPDKADEIITKKMEEYDKEDVFTTGYGDWKPLMNLECMGLESDCGCDSQDNDEECSCLKNNDSCVFYDIGCCRECDCSICFSVCECEYNVETSTVGDLADEKLERYTRHASEHMTGWRWKMKMNMAMIMTTTRTNFETERK